MADCARRAEVIIGISLIRLNETGFSELVAKATETLGCVRP